MNIFFCRIFDMFFYNFHFHLCDYVRCRLGFRRGDSRYRLQPIAETIAAVVSELACRLAVCAVVAATMLCATAEKRLICTMSVVTTVGNAAANQRSFCGNCRVDHRRRRHRHHHSSSSSS